MGILRSLTTATAVLALAGTVAATPLNRPQQRQHFLEARTALEQGNSVRFTQLLETLDDYPLQPYLVAWQMQRQRILPDHEIRRFLERHGDTPFTRPVREQWLRQLAMAERWEDYLAAYRPGSRGEARCNYHYAQWRVGDTIQAWAGARALWLSPNRQESACNRLFEAWAQAGELSGELRRQRLDLILHAGNTAFAKQIAGTLSEAERHRVALWERVHHQPARIDSEKALQPDNATNREIVAYGLQRLARQDAVTATRLWSSVEGRYTFTPEQRSEILNTLVLRLALRSDPATLDWYQQIPIAAVESDTRQWVIRAALRQQRWQAALTALRALPAEERADEEWQYWTARSLEALDDEVGAFERYHAIADNRTYYGFLAADRLNLDYNLSHRPVAVDDSTLEALAQHPSMLRAYELLQLNLTQEARREWEMAIAAMPPHERLAAGKLANRWGWHDRAALTLAKADYFDDLEIRFPLAYTTAVKKEAEVNTLDPAWILAVARQESVMMPDARSPAGALGLMQLMPATGRQIAQQMKSGLNDLQQLLRPELNIRFGSFYLRQLSHKFDGHTALATAAYNAGPHRVQQWAPEQQSIDADIWIDTIPYAETRQYVRRVLSYSVFYDQRLDKPVIRLRERMPAVQKAVAKG